VSGRLVLVKDVVDLGLNLVYGSRHDVIGYGVIC
jgi:hypothetical protein